MFCEKCGKGIDNNAKYCRFCGSAGNVQSITVVPQPPAYQRWQGIVCPRCFSSRVFTQAVAINNYENRGCFMWLVWIFLAICTCGLILIIPLVTNTKSKSATHSQATCQSCGHTWRVG